MIPTLPSRLDLLREALPQTTTVYKTRLIVTQYRGQQDLHLSLYECTLLKNGTYGKGKELFQTSVNRIPTTHRHYIPFLSHGS